MNLPPVHPSENEFCRHAPPKLVLQVFEKALWRALLPGWAFMQVGLVQVKRRKQQALKTLTTSMKEKRVLRTGAGAAAKVGIRAGWLSAGKERKEQKEETKTMNCRNPLVSRP
eukprot:844469-Pelagomonas_calceolata.AAC.1